MSFRKDEQLLNLIMTQPSIEARASMVRQLHPKSVKSLCQHLSQIVHQNKTHSLDSKGREKVSKALKPHSRIVKRLVDRRVRGKIIRNKKVPNLQRGGAIISMILAAVVPILAQMAISALTKKKAH